MSETIISVENLSKRYLVGHRSGERERYTALRDVVAREVRNFTRKAVDAFRGRQIVQGDEVEEFWALKDVSFEVTRGEVLGIIGRNGAGKSTLLKIVSRITEPTAGRVRLHGRVASLLEVGTGFHPELTGRENIFLNGAILGMTRREIRKKLDEIVAFAEVEKFLDTPVKRYSSGMYVRLAFAVAAHLEPEILVVDEVLAVGDAKFQEKCLGKMKNVASQGRTILFITHQMNQIRTLSDRCIWLDNGCVHASGATIEVISAYEVDLASNPEKRRGSRNAEAEFIGWRISDPADKNNIVVDHGPVSVQFSIRVIKPIKHVHHGVLLFNNTNQIIWSAARNNLSLEPGIRELSYDFPSLPLRPGSYSWLVSLWDDRGSIDELRCFPPLVIAAPSWMHPLAHLEGLINMKYEFKVQ
jgi:lipopolysaccharide transport system ATP-binding protein